MAITKPAVLQAWADAAVPTTDIVMPSASFIAAGWAMSSTPPARQYFNWLLNYVFNGIRYQSRRGVADYDAAETYQLNDIVIGDAGSLVQSLAANQLGHTPSTSPTYWGPLKSYATTASVTAAITAALATYETTAAMNTALLNYVTTATLAATLASYETTAALAATLANYATVASLNAYQTTTNAAIVSNLATAESYAAAQAATATTTAENYTNALLTAYSNTAAMNAALALKANLNSPALTGTPTAPTAAPGTNTTQLATTAFTLAAQPDLRHGTFTCTNGTVSVSFGHTFASPPQVFVQWYYTSPAVGFIVPGSITTTGFQYTNSNTGVCNWLAVH